MALPNLSSVLPPSLPLSFDEVPRVIGPQFGDGYTQRSLDGLNALDSTMEVSWEPITKVERDQVINFLRARQGISAFTFTLDGETRTFVAPQWNSTKISANHYKVSAQFKRVFDL